MSPIVECLRMRIFYSRRWGPVWSRKSAKPIAFTARQSSKPSLSRGLPGVLHVCRFAYRPLRKQRCGASRVQPPAVQRGELIYGIASSPSGVVLGAGSGGKIWRTVDLGQSMTVTQSPTTANLQDIAAWSRGEAVAVGDAGTIIVTRNSGQSWTPVKVTLSSIANKLVRVRVFDDGSAWTVGEMGAALRSTDRGATWNRMT